MISKFKEKIVEFLMDRALSRCFVLPQSQAHAHAHSHISFNSIDLQNLQISPEFLNSKLEKFNLSCCKETTEIGNVIERLSIQIDWTGIFKYWTEVVDEEASVAQENTNSDAMVDAGSCIKLSGVQITLNQNDEDKWFDALSLNSSSLELDTDQLVFEIFEEIEQQSSASTTEFDLNLNVISGFIKHVIGQFKIEIQEIRVKIYNFSNNDYRLIHIPKIEYCPRRGFSKTLFSKDSCFFLTSKDHVRFSKGIEVERNQSGVKIHIPHVDLTVNGLDSFHSLYNLIAQFKGTKYSKHPAPPSFELHIDSITVNFHETSLSIHEVLIRNHDNLVEFACGQLHGQWAAFMTFKTENSSLGIMGTIDLQSSLVKIKVFSDLEVTLNALDDFSDTSSSNFAIQHHLQTLSLTLGNVQLNYQAFSVKLSNLSLSQALFEIRSILICYKSSELLLKDFYYTIKDMKSETAAAIDSTNVDSTGFWPFSKTQKFIENEELVEVDVGLELFPNDEVGAKTAEGSVSIADILEIQNSFTSSPKSFQQSCTSLSVAVAKAHLKFQLLDKTSYEIDVSALKASLQNSFFDLRLNASQLKRNEETILKGTDDGLIVFTQSFTETLIKSLHFQGFSLQLPHDFFDLFSNDFGSIFRSSNNEADGLEFFKASNISLELLQPESLRGILPKTEIWLEQAFLKRSANSNGGIKVFLDSLKCLFNDQSIGDGGLIILNVNLREKTIEIQCKSTHFVLNPKGCRDAVAALQGWLEIWAPASISEIPETLFFENDGNDEINTPLTAQWVDNELVIELPQQAKIAEDQEVIEDPDSDIEDLMGQVEDAFFKVKLHAEEERAHGSADGNWSVLIRNFNVFLDLVTFENDGTERKLISSRIEGILGDFSGNRFNLKVRNIKIDDAKSSSTLLCRWDRGPDPNSRRFGSHEFLTLAMRKCPNDLNSTMGIQEFNLSISICPLRLFLAQTTLEKLTCFFDSLETNSSKSAAGGSAIFFNKFTSPPIALKIDYRPDALKFSSSNERSISSSTIPQLPCSLAGAELELSPVDLKGVAGFSALPRALLSAWIPSGTSNGCGSNSAQLIKAIRTGVAPIRTVVRLSDGLVDLILLPLEEKSAVAAAQMRRGSKEIGMQTLKMTGALARNAHRLLQQEGQEQPQLLLQSSNRPTSIGEAIKDVRRVIVAWPVKARTNLSRNCIQAVPLMVLDGMGLVSEVVATTLDGLEAEFDDETRRDRLLKFNKK